MTHEQMKSHIAEKIVWTLDRQRDSLKENLCEVPDSALDEADALADVMVNEVIKEIKRDYRIP